MLLPQGGWMQVSVKPPDSGSVSAYARDAMAWAVGNGLIGGLPHGKRDYLEPGGGATRAQVATILMRYKQATA